MKYDTVIFDFDGTLFDTSDGITFHVDRTIKEMGCAPLPQNTLKKFIGPSLLVSFQKYCNMTEEQALKAIYVYRREYDVEGFKLSKPYEGIAELLSDLRNNGVKIVVASAKPQYILDPTIDYFGFRGYFDKIAGAQTEGRKSNDKKEIIKSGIIGERAIMVGDSVYDIDGGKDNGIDTVAVSYGFGFTSLKEAQKSGATYIADSVQNLKTILLS